MWGAAEVGAMTPMVAVLTLGEWFAVLDVMVIGIAPCAVKGVVAGTVGPGVIEVVAGVVDLVVGHMSKGGHAVDDPGGDAVVGVGVSKCLDAFKVLLHDVFKVCSQGHNVVGNVACPFVEGSVAGDLGLQGVVLFLVHCPIH